MEPTLSDSELEEQRRVHRTLLRAALGAFIGLVSVCAAVVAIAVANGPRPLPTRTVTVTAAAAPVAPINVTIAGSNKRGPDGQMHDSFSVTDFHVTAGQAVTLNINNTDGSPHSITAPSADVNIVAQPGDHSYTLLVKHSGRFLWFCALPCDSDAHGWAMSNPGFMSGYIVAS